MTESLLPDTLLGDQAIVIGGSMAGLLSAHVLSKYFKRVSLIERDRYPKEPVFRSGVPQGRHVHIMLVRGQQILEAYFPGIKDKLVARGAIEGDFSADYRTRFPSGWAPRLPSCLHGYACTRPLLEWQVYQEILANERVYVIEGHEVVNLLANKDGQAVTGVQMRERTRAAVVEHQLVNLEADLVVDASGRDSKLSHWLKSLGYALPSETVINPFFGYSTRLYTPPADPTRAWKGMVIHPEVPKNLRGGVIWPTERGDWLVVLAGTGKDYPPTDDEGFMEFVKSLPASEFYEALKNAQPISPIYGYRRTENRWRHFERLSRLPHGFLVLGDAVCAFNPVYGQGMTVAALDAATLDECLHLQAKSSDLGLTGLPRRFQRKLAGVIETPWQLATSADSRVPGLEGAKPNWVKRLTYRYFDSVLEILPTSPLVSKTFSQVLHLIEPPTVLFRPAIVASVLMHALSGLRMRLQDDLAHPKPRATNVRQG